MISTVLSNEQGAKHRNRSHDDGNTGLDLQPEKYPKSIAYAFVARRRREARRATDAADSHEDGEAEERCDTVFCSTFQSGVADEEEGDADY